VIDAGDGRVLVLTNDDACPKGASAEVTFLGAPVWTLRISETHAWGNLGCNLARKFESAMQCMQSDSWVYRLPHTGRSRLSQMARREPPSTGIIAPVM